MKIFICLFLLTAGGAQALCATEPVDVLARVAATDISGDPPRPEVALAVLEAPDGSGLTRGEQLTIPVEIKQWEAFWHRSVGKAYTVTLTSSKEHGWQIAEIGERVSEDALDALSAEDSAAGPSAGPAEASSDEGVGGVTLPDAQSAPAPDAADASAVSPPDQGVVDARIRAHLQAQRAVIARRLAELEEAGAEGATVNPDARALLEQELASLGEQLAAFTGSVDAFDRALMADLAQIEPERLTPAQRVAVHDLARLAALRTAGAGTKMATLQRLRADLAAKTSGADSAQTDAVLARPVDALLGEQASATGSAQPQAELWVLDVGPTALVAYSGTLVPGPVRLGAEGRASVIAADGRYAVVVPLDQADALTVGARVVAIADRGTER